MTAKTLLARFGPGGLQGANSITGVLAAKGFDVNPRPDATSLREDPRFSGGHTVFTYGSHDPRGIDAIQLEFGRQQRSNPRLAEDVAEAVLKFMQAHGLVAK